MTELLVLDPGPQTTVQDLGRFGSQSLGVPPAGAADPDALETANLLVGNARGEACLECTLRGPELEFTGPASFSVCGARIPVLLNGIAVPTWETLYAEAGDVLSIGTAETGLRAYLAAAGGFDVPVVLGSRSTYVRAGFGGWQGRPLRSGDRIPLRGTQDTARVPRLRVPEDIRPEYPVDIQVRAVPSHELDRFPPDSVDLFFREVFSVSAKSDRMGCRLEGTPLRHTRGADIVSSGVQTGTVQVPGDGLPIVLLPDRQTTGGYTRIAHVIRADLSKLGQARPGDRVRFLRIGLEEARTAWIARDEEIAGRIRSADESSGRASPRTAVPAGASIRRFRVLVEGRPYDVEIEET